MRVDHFVRSNQPSGEGKGVSIKGGYVFSLLYQVVSRKLALEQVPKKMMIQMEMGMRATFYICPAHEVSNVSDLRVSKRDHMR